MIGRGEGVPNPTICILRILGFGEKKIICESRAQNEWTPLGFAGRKNVCSLDVRFFNIEEIVDPQRVLGGVRFHIFSCKALRLMSIGKLNSNQKGKDIHLLQIMEK